MLSLHGKEMLNAAAAAARKRLFSSQFNIERRRMINGR
jgi:hypothetical protein